MNRRSQVRIIVIVGGMMIFLQAVIHSFFGYPSVTGAAQKHITDILFWAWFALGFGLASLGLLAVYVAYWLASGKRWAMIIATAIGATTLFILIPAAIIGIGYPVIGIAGGLLLLVPLIWVGRFSER